MAMDPRKRQKKLALRKAKQKAKARKKAAGGRARHGLAQCIERCASAPILHCCTTAALWKQGMSNVLVSRQLDSGNVAFAAFLVHMYCLGVKDATSDVLPRGRYDWQVYSKLMADRGIVDFDRLGHWRPCGLCDCARSAHTGALCPAPAVQTRLGESPRRAAR